MKYFILIFLILAFSACKENTKSDDKKIPEEKREERIPEKVLTEEEQVQALIYEIEMNPMLAENYYKIAKIYLKRGDLYNANENLKGAISMDSLQMKYYTLWADLHIRGQKMELAKTILRVANRINPEASEPLFKLGEVYALDGSQPKINEKKLDSAFIFINQGLKIDITNPYAYYLKGLIYKRLDKFVKSTESFQTAIEQDPEYYDAYLELGLSYINRDSLLGVQYLSNAIKSNPERKEALFYRGKYFQEIDSIHLAKNDFEKVILIDSTYANVFYRLGAIALQENEIKKAENYFSNAVKNNSNYYQAIAARGYCYELQKLKDKALADYQSALNLKPNYEIAAEGKKRISNIE